MSKPSCDACTRLREYNANFIMNGVTDDIATSLKNNTGLNSCLTELHTDCEDLNDVNDCLIGHMDDDVDNYEVCDWKDLLHNFFPNLYETLKAIIATICGLWTSMDKIKQDICVLAGNQLNTSSDIVYGHWYGTYASVDKKYNGLDGAVPGFSFWKLDTAFPLSCDSIDEDDKTILQNVEFHFRNRFNDAGTSQYVNITLSNIERNVNVGYFTESDFTDAGLTTDIWDAIKKKSYSHNHEFLLPGGLVAWITFSTQYDSSTKRINVWVQSWVQGEASIANTENWVA